MSVATAITDLSARIQGAFQACEEKGATMPESRTTHTLSATIESIQGGGLPSKVVLSGNVPAYGNYMRWGTTYAGQPITLTDVGKAATEADMSSIGTVGNYGMAFAFRQNTNISAYTMPDRMDCTNNYSWRQSFNGSGITGNVVAKVSSTGTTLGNYALEGCFQNTAIQELTLDFQLSSFTLTTSNANIFTSLAKTCTSLKKFTMKGLKSLNISTTASGQGLFGDGTSHAFRDCGSRGIGEYVIEDLEYVYGNSASSSPSFGILSYYDNALAYATLRFPKLKEIRTNTNATCTTSFIMSGTGWGRCKEIYMPSCTFVGQWALNGVRAATVHFSASNREAIEACAGYSSKFQRTGGDGTMTIVFDL